MNTLKVGEQCCAKPLLIWDFTNGQRQRKLTCCQTEEHAQCPGLWDCSQGFLPPGPGWIAGPAPLILRMASRFAQVRGMSVDVTRVIFLMLVLRPLCPLPRHIYLSPRWTRSTSQK